MALTIPLLAQPQQTVNCSLDNQQCAITLRTMTIGDGIADTILCCDLYIGSALIVGGVVCEDRNRIVRDAYLGFHGDLAFVDTQGTSDPTADGLGDRFKLVYLTPDELAQ